MKHNKLFNNIPAAILNFRIVRQNFFPRKRRKFLVLCTGIKNKILKFFQSQNKYSKRVPSSLDAWKSVFIHSERKVRDLDGKKLVGMSGWKECSTKLLNLLFTSTDQCFAARLAHQ